MHPPTSNIPAVAKNGNVSVNNDLFQFSLALAFLLLKIIIITTTIIIILYNS
jgi:hypothetical protein